MIGVFLKECEIEGEGEWQRFLRRKRRKNVFYLWR